MKLGMIGLGKMGANMTRRLLQNGVGVVGFDYSQEVVNNLSQEGLEPASSYQDMIEKLSSEEKICIWLMVPAGEITEKVILELKNILRPGDIIIDGGNSNYKDTILYSRMLEENKIYLVDVGTSGGVWGLKEGYAMMIGGKQEPIDYLKNIFEILAPAKDKGWARMGESGAGHYVKMIHNGIEYGMMQAYAEGFELMASKKEFDLDIVEIAELWRHGSVVRSWLLDLTAQALANDNFSEISDYVADSGEGRWTIIDSIEQGVPAPVITLATQMRFRSQQDISLAGQILSVMRRAFGGHSVVEQSKDK